MAWEVWLKTALGILLGAVSVAYLALTALLLMECLLALFPVSKKSQPDNSESALSFAVLMPAHNEESVIKNTLNQLIPEVDSPNKIWVIADNCSDQTAELARTTGVTVLERTDTSRRGKGYALDYGLRALAEHQPDVVVMVDADCWVTPGTLDRIAQEAFHSDRPVQALYLMEQPIEPTLRDRVSAFAMTVKNRVRTQGLTQIGAPIMLGGTGMAFPWKALQSVELASGHIVEDMKLGMDLAIAGYKTTLDPKSQVIGVLPDDSEAAKSQRTRWEHGHLQVLKTYVPKLVGQSVRQLRPDLLFLALDLAIPPLALWSILGLLATVVTGITTLFGVILPFQIQLVADVILVSTILICWIVWGRKTLTFSQLIAIPLYIFWKVPIYIKAFLKPEKDWVRTKRNT
ncbi:glycosyltransferase family 2 protein [Oscillatoria sp. CS-180]|uniref:glycosyltransferase family 2 protein n=1 Tax=Oscillatoria sp. CS-180 TaxID=3021720 RepID=UPI00232FB0D5|nr:glycosyltransferase family 2 protein [Oscillatoria sp. CS-180]MDB9524431.1 glycosyltransferase family 2 protein [Oscillatoria sp. CS-180]